MGFAGGGHTIEQPLLSQSRFPACYQIYIFSFNAIFREKKISKICNSNILLVKPLYPAQPQGSTDPEYTCRENHQENGDTVAKITMFKNSQHFLSGCQELLSSACIWLGPCCLQPRPATSHTAPPLWYCHLLESQVLHWRGIFYICVVRMF